jgi:type VII secretion integral membrane protein EccD
LQTAYSRVTVVTQERTVDLALPTALPLAEVMPQLMRYAAPGNGVGTGGGPTSWTLARMGGTHLSLAQTLADAGVRDGDILELRPEGQGPRPVLVEDVRDAVEDSVDAAGGTWTTRTTSSFVVLAGSIVLLALAALIALAGLSTSADWPTDLNSPATGGTAVVVMGFATWWASRTARDGDAQAAAVAAMAWGAMLALAVADLADADPWVTATACVAAAAVVAGVTRLVTPVTTGHVAFAAVLLVVTVAMLVAQTWDRTQDIAPRVAPVLTLLAVGAIPRVSLSVGGLASADYRVRNVGVLELPVLQARYRASNAILVGSLAAIAVVVTWFGGVLALATDPWDRALSLALAAGLVLRSRAFSRTQHMAPLRAAGLLLVLVGLGRLAVDEPELLPWLGVVLAASVLAGIGLASIEMSEISRARVKRTLNIVEFLTLIVILVLLFGALTVYAQFEGIFG